MQQGSQAGGAPVIVVEDEKCVVGRLVAASSIADGGAPATRVHAPHPELDSDGCAGPLFKIAQHQRLQTWKLPISTPSGCAQLAHMF